MGTKYSFIYTSVPPMTVTSPSFLSFRADDKDFVQASASSCSRAKNSLENPRN